MPKKRNEGVLKKRRRAAKGATAAHTAIGASKWSPKKQRAWKARGSFGPASDVVHIKPEQG